MRVEKLGLKHKGLLYDRLRGIDTPISEYSFSNCYLFRDVHEFEVVTDGEVFVRGKTYDGFTYLMPTRDLNEADLGQGMQALSTVDFLYPVPEDRLSLFSGEECEFVLREADMDYVYTVEKMSTYAGRKLHRKRNLLRQFVRSYGHEALPLTAERLDDARLVLERWQAGSGRTGWENDYLPCLEALRLYDELGLCGGICYADGRPAGFIIGEELNDETFVVRFAKALVEFKGIYQYMFNRFAKVLPRKYRLMNFEQDLAIEHLRHAKESYCPDMKLAKYRVGLRRRAPSARRRP